MLNNAPIGVFDSGVGGISVLRELIKMMPEEKYLYFGDSANAPYGSKTTAQVRELTLEAAQMLVSRGIKALVVACNTATAAAKMATIASATGKFCFRDVWQTRLIFILRQGCDVKSIRMVKSPSEVGVPFLYGERSVRNGAPSKDK